MIECDTEHYHKSYCERKYSVQNQSGCTLLSIDSADYDLQKHMLFNFEEHPSEIKNQSMVVREDFPSEHIYYPTKKVIYNKIPRYNKNTNEY